MIISRKRFQEEINKAVHKAVDEQNERRFLDERFMNMERNFDYRMEKMHERIRSLEKAVFPNEKEECGNSETVNKCGY